jgi:hypothetical protein
VRQWTNEVVAPLKEENSILWWLVSGGGSDFARFVNIASPHGLGVIAGWELAELVKVLPGPDPAQLLNQVLSYVPEVAEANSLAIPESLKGLPTEVAIPHLVDDIADLTPILAVANGRPVADNPAAPTLTPLELGERSYLELLLLRALEAAS